LLETPQEDPIATLLRRARTIAIVGISEKRHRDSFQIAEYLLAQGYRVIPINPKFTELLTQPCYPDLQSVAEPVDIVNVFRRAEAMPEVAADAIAAKARALWMQLGLRHEQAGETARAAGLDVVMDRCIKIEHRRLQG